jgi:hypothetical protein
MFICRNDLNNLTFAVTPEASKLQRYEILKNKSNILDSMCKITVTFRERTDSLIPYHANGTIRYKGQ